MGFTFLDGATGTNLMKAGLPRGVCVEQWVLENPDVIVSLQKEYVESGADIVYSPTFGANPVSLRKYGLEAKTEEMNEALVSLSKKATQGKAKVAGDISSTGLLMAPMGDASYEEIKQAFMRQASAIDKANADLFILETFSSLGECLAAFDGVRAVSDKDIMVSVTLEQGGKTLCGDTPEACLIALSARGAVAFGVNCSSGIESMAKTIESLYDVSDIPLISKPNAGLPVLVDGENVFPDTSEDFAKKYQILVEKGACFVGGCCGTTPSHIKALNQSLGDKSPKEIKKTKTYACSNNSIFEIPKMSNDSLPSRVMCDEDMIFSIPEKGEAEYFRLFIERDEQLENFIEGMSSIETPLVLGAKNEELFEKAVALYVGRCILDEECGFQKEKIEKMKEKYGFIVLSEIE